ncbi:MAG TPA: lysophospholipid acyltransferase family protein [Steroidobacteraceae bacterium]|nr:lysophospholipid acyltransferase family protein [Steroidobacteraceae bacterium]
MQWLASLLFTSFLFVSTFVYAFVVVGSFWLPFPRRYAVARGWAQLELAAVKYLCGLDYAVEGRHHIPAGAHISMWKHSSAWETMAQMVIFPPQAWVLKREILWIPVIGWATWLMEPIAINRSAGSTAVKEVLSQGRRRLEQGRWVLVFPEGTRVAVGQTRKYGLSGALLAAETGRQIVPVAHDAGRYWSRRGLLKKRGTIRVVIGPPIVTAGREARDIIEDTRAWIDGKVAELGA